MLLRFLRQRFRTSGARRDSSRSSSLRNGGCNRKDRAAGIRLDVASGRSDVIAIAGQETVFGQDGEETILTARTNEEPQK